MKTAVCNAPGCSHQFTWTDDDVAQLKLYGIEKLPTYCPQCRHQRRAVFMPGAHLYKRTSAHSGKTLYTVYPPTAPFPVYAADEWESDCWDPLSYGRRFDPQQKFFKQFEELFRAIPKAHNLTTNSENSDYAIYCANSKNIYYSAMVFRNSEDIYYSISITDGSDISDCVRCFSSSSLYESVQCSDCHHSAYLFDCHNSRDAYFCYDIKNCSDCLFCSNLRNKNYYYKNEYVGKERFLQLKREHLSGSYTHTTHHIAAWHNLIAQAFRRDQSQTNCENCYGHGLLNSSDSYECYHSINLKNNRYCEHIGAFQTNSQSMDVTQGGIGERLYNCTACGAYNTNLRMCAICRTSSNLTYCTYCYNCKDCFGCCNLRNAQYCILNKQYSKEEYDEAVAQIIKRMIDDEEWGEFFPVSMSPFAYNESMAMLFYPQSKNETIAKGGRWTDLQPQDTSPEDHEFPDLVSETDQRHIEKPVFCGYSNRWFRVVTKELSLLKRLSQPLPRQHPFYRMARKFEMLGPSELLPGECRKCRQPVTYQPNPYNDNYYCESCYLEAI